LGTGYVPPLRNFIYKLNFGGKISEGTYWRVKRINGGEGEED